MDQKLEVLEHNIPTLCSDFPDDNHTKVTVIDREEYTGSVIIAHGNYDPEVS